MQNDNNLILLIKVGNHLAFQTLYDKYWESLFIYSYNILNDKWLAEDVLQEIFTRLWSKREDLEIENIKAYLYGAVRNGALTKIRNDKFSSLDEAVVGKLEVVSDVDHHIRHNDLMLSIEDSIKKLPERCREIFYMSKIEHYSTQEIAQHFDISPRTVENQVSLALKHLRAELAPHFNTLLLLHLLFP